MDKIIKVNFEEWQNTAYVDEGLLAWNYGQILQVEGLTLPDGDVEVHFSLTDREGDANVYIGTVKDNVITVDIPSFIFQKENVFQPTYDAYAFIYQTDEESGRTIKKITFTIQVRPKPTTDIPKDQKDLFLEEVRQVMAETKEIAQGVRDDADNGKLNGKDGADGKDGKDGAKGDDGKSAYEYAIEGGFTGTEQEFIDLLAKAGQVDLSGYITKSEHEEQLLKAMVKVTTEEAEFHHITDSANFKVVDFGMSGITEQDTVPGNQLFDISKMELVNATNIGITEIGENYIVITTYDGYTGNGLVSAGKTLQELCPMLEVGETYILTATTESATMARIYVGTAWGFGSTAVMTEDMLNATVIFYGHSYINSIGSCKISNIQIQKGNTALPFEEYVGGMPSPNPDYPQEITNAGVYNEETGRYEIGCRVWNKNVVDLNKLPDINGLYKSWLIPNYGDMKVTITLVDKNNGVDISGIYFGTTTHGDNSGSICWWIQKGTINQYIYTVPSTHKYVSIYPKSADLLQKLLERFDIQVELGSTETNYTPHASQPFTLTSPVPLTKWDKLVKRDGVWGWSVFHKIRENIQLVNETIADAQYGAYARFYVQSIKAFVGAEGKCDSFRVNTSHSLADNICGFFYGEDFCIVKSKESLGITDEDNADSRIEKLLSYMSDKPFELIHQTKEEQAFHPLPDEEQTLLHNLETYYGVTNVYNDQGCPMWLTYVADQELHWNKKFLEIQQAII